MSTPLSLSVEIPNPIPRRFCKNNSKNLHDFQYILKQRHDGLSSGLDLSRGIYSCMYNNRNRLRIERVHAFISMRFKFYSMVYLFVQNTLLNIPLITDNTLTRIFMNEIPVVSFSNGCIGNARVFARAFLRSL